MLFRYYPCCGQENWFQNQSTSDFSVDKRWTPILSIATPIINFVTNILLWITGHKHMEWKIAMLVHQYPQWPNTQERDFIDIPH